MVGHLQVFLCYIIFCTHSIISFLIRRTPKGVRAATNQLVFKKLPELAVSLGVIKSMIFSWR